MRPQTPTALPKPETSRGRSDPAQALPHPSRPGRWPGFLLSGWLLAAGWTPSAGAATAPVITSVVRTDGDLVVVVDAPSGYRHAVLDAGTAVEIPLEQAWVAGPLNGDRAWVTFRVPNPSATTFLRVRLGTESDVPPARHSGSPFYAVEYPGGDAAPLTDAEKAGHVLARLSYGPSTAEVQQVATLGVGPYITRQLNPETIDESDNAELQAAEEALFERHQPSEDTLWIQAGDNWHYLKGTQAPPATWAQPDFDSSDWLAGPTGIGYGDDDDATVLDDMRQAEGVPGYLTVFLRKTFQVTTPEGFDELVLRIDYDDGFVAYLNGTEVARANVSGTPPAFDATTPNDHEAGEPEDFDLSAHRGLLRAGDNVLAIEVHNVSRTSSDLSLIPALLGRRYLPLPAERRIRSIESLQQLVHIRGILARRQLQAVLAEFWDNHFTTDQDKVAEYFAELRNSDARLAMSEAQANAEAAQAEYLEYQFFHDHALGNFGDLLLYSATSPTQLIYLDNVLNVRGAANENYAREILELFAFGVDNRYTQVDIEQLARCFTGWTVRKVWPDQKPAFPASALAPPMTDNVQFQDDLLLPIGPGWTYLKGTREPSPASGGAPTLAWTEPEFDDATWTAGATSIGYGDGDDATVLGDMRNQYLSVYLRRTFTVADPASLENLLLAVDYDDGFVAYLNGTEVARSRTMADTGTPPPFDQSAAGSHEAGRAEDTFSLRDYRHLLRPAPSPNVLAIQVHNITLNSSDLSIHPRLVDRKILPGSIENGDENGTWTFRFDPEEHDTEAKVLFAGTPYERHIPAGRTGAEGLRDALDVIDTFVNHPSVSEFICLKLINKLVSDEISLASYRDGTAPEGLRQMLDDAIAAWHGTQPAGNLRTVLETLLRPTSLDGYFWSRSAYRAKVKTPVEFINSSVRALQASVSGTSLPAQNDLMGMHLFTRDDPDGWSEIGSDWIDTGTLLARIGFAQDLTANRLSGVRWDVASWAPAAGITDAASIVDYFNALLFQGALDPANRSLLIEFGNTDDAGNPLPLDPARNDYAARVRELVSLILALPQWHYQ